MKTTYVPNIFRNRPFLDGRDLFEVNMNPIFVDYKTLENYTIHTKEYTYSLGQRLGPVLSSLYLFVFK